MQALLDATPELARAYSRGLNCIKQN